MVFNITNSVIAKDRILRKKNNVHQKWLKLNNKWNVHKRLEGNKIILTFP